MCTLNVKCFENDSNKTHVEILRSKIGVCRVCGYEYANFFPWGETGCDPSHAICQCCNVEFGYEDSSLSAIRSYRKKWISKGAPWSNEEKKPNDWSLDSSLANIPKVFI